MDPWMKPVPIFGGTSLVFLDTIFQWNFESMGSLRWLILIPICLGFAYTLSGMHFEQRKPIQVLSKYQLPIHIAYAVMVGSLVISMVIKVVENEEKSYGMLLAIPLMALCAINVSNGTPNSPNNVDHFGQIWGDLTGMIGSISMTLVNLGVIITSILWVFMTPTSSTPSSVSTNYQGSGPMIFLYVILMIPSTPILNFPHNFNLIPQNQANINTMLASTWYAMLFVSASSNMFFLTWGGIPVLVVSALSLLDISFTDQDSYPWKMSWCMLSILLGTFLSWDSSIIWWLRMAITMGIGVCRIVLVYFFPIEWVDVVKYDGDRFNTPQKGNYRILANRPMFHNIRVEIKP